MTEKRKRKIDRRRETRLSEVGREEEKGRQEKLNEGVEQEIRNVRSLRLAELCSLSR